MALLGWILLLEACVSSSDFELGNRSARAGDWDAAVAWYRKAQEQEPDDEEIRAALLLAALEASRVHVRLARERLERNDLEGAASELQIALELDPTNRYVRDELEEIRDSLSEPPSPAVFPRESFPSALVHLSFPEPTSLRTILEELGDLAGVNVLFDESFRDRQVTIALEGVTFEQALELVLQTHGLFYKVVDSKTLRFAPHW
jgi:tetratricopeptide (TPR) repeat protein